MHSISRDPRQVHLRRHCGHARAPALAVPTLAQCRHWKGDITGMRHLRHLLNFLGTAHLARMSDDDVVEQVVRHIATGQLCIQVVHSAAIAPKQAPKSFVSAGTPAGALPAPVPARTAQRTGSSVTGVVLPPTEMSWIELQMIGEDDRPLANIAYSVVLSDGTTREGTLDASGLARIDGIPPGNVIASFPELDRDAWTLA